MTHGSLFSGIGGFDLAAEWMGWENLFHCEWNEFGQKVLKYYFQNAESFTDITKTDFTKYANRIDVLTGGFPCQPYSLAGKRIGKEDDRHLWPEMLRAIREIKPTWVVGENVYGLVNWNGGLVFHEVQVDLEAQGYEVFPFLLPACGVNAPHQRFRIFFVAYSKPCADSRNTRGISKEANQKNTRGKESNTASEQQVQLPSQPSSVFGDAADTDNPSTKHKIQTGRNLPASKDYARNAADTESRWAGKFSSTNEGGKDRRFNNNGEIWNASDTSNTELQRSKFDRSIREKGKIESKGRQSCRPICGQWENFPTVSPICDGDDGLSDRLDTITFSKWRNESIKAGGNAIVPQLVLQIFKAIQQYNDIAD
jgi:DNA (cytosine-5)-methyltransferase 1